MSTNFKGDPLSNEQIYSFALKLRKAAGLDDVEVVDLLELYDRPSILTRFGLKHFVYKVVPDLEIEGNEASTLITHSHVRVRISKTTFQRAEALDRRARFTLAHELGHAVLHKNKEDLNRSQSPERRTVSAVVSVERQADRFADGFLITDAMVQLATSADHLSEIALVSDRVSNIVWRESKTGGGDQRLPTGFVN